MIKKNGLYKISKMSKISNDVKPKILWHDSYMNGPISGLAVIGTQKCWFQVKNMGRGLNIPRNLAELTISDSDEESDINSTDVPITPDIDHDIEPDSDSDSESSDSDYIDSGFLGRNFDFYALSETNLKLIEQDHENFRNEVGYHTEHDPLLYKPLAINYIINDKNTNYLIFTHQVNPHSMLGENLGSFEDYEIDNYYLPNLN